MFFVFGQDEMIPGLSLMTGQGWPKPPHPPKKTKRHNCVCVRNFVSRIFHLGACSIKTLLVAEGQGFFLPGAQHGQ